MSRIGSGGIPPKPTDTPAVGERADVKRESGDLGAGKVSQKVVDSFQRSGAALESKMQALGGAQLAQKLSFSSEDLAVLAQQFAGIVRNNPHADRLKRAKLFAKAILKKKGAAARGKLARLLDDENEEHSEQDRKSLEEMYDMIAEQLDSTPVFAQLVDEVTESARKIR
jgi:hypothetical protein